LFVAFVAGYERTPRPSLRAGNHISANDETFKGHFPQFAIWPGIHTVEGLNQACNLLAIISSVQKQWEEAGRDPAEVLEALRHIDQVYELKAPLRVDLVAPLLEMLRGGGTRVGLSVGIDVRFTSPVFAGNRLEYLVTETHADDAAMRYEVEAVVEGTSVARGRLTLSRARPIPSLPA
jgi:3-hydroxyacyl-[acyl-carrier-protein] dehydratase